MYIVEVQVNPYNDYGYKKKFEFKCYSDYSEFINMLINTNKDYLYLNSPDDTSDKEV